MKSFIGIIIGLLIIFTMLYIIGESFGITKEKYVRDVFDKVTNSEYGRITVFLSVIIILVADLFLPVPSSFVMVLSGYFLGFYAGVIANFIGAMGSSILGFLLCRQFGQKLFNKIIGEKDLTIVNKILEKYGPYAIILSRPLPMMAETISCVMGLGKTSFLSFVLISIIGTFPICLVYSWAGAFSKNVLWWAVVIAFIIPLTGFLLLKGLERKIKA